MQRPANWILDAAYILFYFLNLNTGIGQRNCEQKKQTNIGRNKFDIAKQTHGDQDKEIGIDPKNMCGR